MENAGNGEQADDKGQSRDKKRSKVILAISFEILGRDNGPEAARRFLDQRLPAASAELVFRIDLRLAVGAFSHGSGLQGSRRRAWRSCFKYYLAQTAGQRQRAVGRPSATRGRLQEHALARTACCPREATVSPGCYRGAGVRTPGIGASGLSVLRSLSSAVPRALRFYKAWK